MVMLWWHRPPMDTASGRVTATSMSAHAAQAEQAGLAGKQGSVAGEDAGRHGRCYSLAGIRRRWRQGLVEGWVGAGIGSKLCFVAVCVRVRVLAFLALAGGVRLLSLGRWCVFRP